MHGKFRFVGEQLGKGLRFLRLTTLVPGEMERIADDDFRAAVFPDESGQRPQVFARLFADEGQNWLRDQTETIGYGNTDAAVSHVQAHEPRYCILLHTSILRGNGEIIRRHVRDKIQVKMSRIIQSKMGIKTNYRSS